MLLEVSVTISDINSDGITMANSASASNHQRSCGSQHACLCSFAQAAHEQPVFAAQHAGECLVQHSAQHTSRKQLRAFLQLSSLARSPTPIAPGR